MNTLSLSYPETSALFTLGVFAAVVICCLGINLVGVRLSTGNFQSMLQTRNWIAPMAAIVLISAASTLLLCPSPWVFWLSLELAALGIGAFVGMVLAMNAGKDGKEGDTDAKAPARALSNLGLVADWITKTLLGATLVSLKDLIGWLWGIAVQASTTIYGSERAAPVITVFGAEFFILGVLLGLLIVRIYLSAYFDSNSAA